MRCRNPVPGGREGAAQLCLDALEHRLDRIGGESMVFGRAPVSSAADKPAVTPKVAI